MHAEQCTLTEPMSGCRGHCSYFVSQLQQWIVLLAKNCCNTVQNSENLQDDWKKIQYFEAVEQIAKDLGIDESGYRLVNNCGDEGGQTVNHLHFHLIGGRSMQWPPG